MLKFPLPAPSPQFAQLVPLFLDVKNYVLLRITEPMITTMLGVIIVIIILLLMMILVLKMTNKYTHNMILILRYKGQLHGEKRANKFGQGPPPLFGRSPKENVFFFCEVFP